MKTDRALRLAAILALSLAPIACKAEVEDPGAPPEVNVEPGRAPDIDVQTPDVDVTTDTQRVVTPEVNVTPPQ